MSIVIPNPGVPLAVQVRSGKVESVHVGHLAVIAPDGRLLSSRGEPQTAFYARSTLKPVQVLPLLLSGAADAFGLPDACLAVAMASHSGEPCHTEAVTELLARAGVSVDALQCGTHAPYHAATAEQLMRARELPHVLHCNCSGKHAGMLAACRHQGWDLATYRAPEHPLQRLIRSLLSELSGVPEAAIGFGVDGCGVPVWHLPLTGLALAFARLTTPAGLRAPLQEAALRATSLMASHPRLVAGEGRLDTDLMAACGGRLVAKIGGEGVHVGGWLGQGVGWAIKVADGNRRAIGPALARALGEVGHPLPADAALSAHLAPEVRNNRGERVGEIVAAW